MKHYELRGRLGKAETNQTGLQYMYVMEKNGFYPFCLKSGKSTLSGKTGFFEILK